MDAEQELWEEVIGEAACECDAWKLLTKEQISCIAKAARRFHDNYHYSFPSPSSRECSEITRLEKELQKEREMRGCPDCAGRGRVEYQAGPWFCNTNCDTCHGKGKIA